MGAFKDARGEAWWFYAMLMLAEVKTKNKRTPKEYDEYTEEFVDFLIQYGPTPKKQLFKWKGPEHDTYGKKQTRISLREMQPPPPKVGR